MSGVTKPVVKDTKVISNCQTMVSDAELVTNTHVEKDVFCSIGYQSKTILLCKECFTTTQSQHKAN